MAAQLHDIPNVELIRSGDELVQSLQNHEIGFVDDIIDELARKNHSDELGPAGRPDFFDVIFSKGWNTSKKVVQPASLAPGTSAISVSVGTLTRDCAASYQAAARGEASCGGARGGRVSRSGGVIRLVDNPGNNVRRQRQLTSS